MCHICTYIYIYICKYTSEIHLRLFMNIYIYIYSHPQTDLFRSIRTHQCGYIYIYIYAIIPHRYTLTSLSPSIYIYIYIYTFMNRSRYISLLWEKMRDMPRSYPLTHVLLCRRSIHCFAQSSLASVNDHYSISREGYQKGITNQFLFSEWWEWSRKLWKF